MGDYPSEKDVPDLTMEEEEEAEEIMSQPQVEDPQKKRKRELAEAKANVQTRKSLEERVKALEMAAGLRPFRGPSD